MCGEVVGGWGGWIGNNKKKYICKRLRLRRGKLINISKLNMYEIEP